MKDVQREKDMRNLAIDRVGIKSLRYPITVLDKKNNKQHTIADVEMNVSLAADEKGTHMSRFIKILNEFRDKITMGNMVDVLKVIKERLEAEEAFMTIKFPYFLEKTAPKSGIKSLMDYDCSFIGACGKDYDEFILKVEVPITSLCPCSKEISDYGAHNQRSTLTIEVKYDDFIWLEELIEIAETSGSCELFSLLKRSDEKYVTERAYENPGFAEDIVREAAQNIMKLKNITWFKVQVENFESIHNHSAFAMIEKQLK